MSWIEGLLWHLLTLGLYFTAGLILMLILIGIPVGFIFWIGSQVGDYGHGDKQHELV